MYLLRNLTVDMEDYLLTSSTNSKPSQTTRRNQYKEKSIEAYFYRKCLNFGQVSMNQRHFLSLRCFYWWSFYSSYYRIKINLNFLKHFHFVTKGFKFHFRSHQSSSHLTRWLRWTYYVRTPNFSYELCCGPGFVAPGFVAPGFVAPGLEIFWLGRKVFY